LPPAFIVDWNGDLKHGSKRLLDIEAGENGKVAVIERVRLHRGVEGVAVPDLEVVVRSHDEHVAMDGGALAQNGGGPESVRSVDLGLVAEEVPVPPDPLDRRVAGGGGRQLLLDRTPRLERVDPGTVATQARDEEAPAVLVGNDGPEPAGQFEPALLVDLRGRV